VNYMVWIVAGFALLFFATRVEAFGDLGSGPAERLPFYFAAVAMMIGAAFSFYKGWRGAMAAINANDSDSSTEVPSDKSSAATRLDDADASSSFDADAALARYMENRSKAPAVHESDGTPVRSSFGRKNS